MGCGRSSAVVEESEVIDSTKLRPSRTPSVISLNSLLDNAVTYKAFVDFLVQPVLLAGGRACTDNYARRSLLGRRAALGQCPGVPSCRPPWALSLWILHVLGPPLLRCAASLLA